MARQHDPDDEVNKSFSGWSGSQIVDGGATVLIMYRSFELVPVKVGEMWQAHISSGGRRVAATPTYATEEHAMREARKIVDGIRNSRRSA